MTAHNLCTSGFVLSAIDRIISSFLGLELDCRGRCGSSTLSAGEDPGSPRKTHNATVILGHIGPWNPVLFTPGSPPGKKVTPDLVAEVKIVDSYWSQIKAKPHFQHKNKKLGLIGKDEKTL